MEEHYLRSNKDLPGDIRAHEIKENRKLQKDSSKIFLKWKRFINIILPVGLSTGRAKYLLLFEQYILVQMRRLDILL